MKKILVPIDGSPLSKRALPYAAALARATHARILLLEAALARPRLIDDLAVAQVAAVATAEYEVEQTARPLRAQGLEVEAHVPYGAAASAILDAALFDRVDLIVMSSHGRSGLGRWVYGSVTDRVLRRADVPVLVIPPGATMAWTIDADPTVLVPLDGSELAEAALGPAQELAAALGARLLLLGVIEPLTYEPALAAIPSIGVDPEEMRQGALGYLEQVAARLRDASRMVEVRGEIGLPATTIARVAHEVGAAAVALATHGRGGLARLVMGSVATGVLQRADAPVLLVRPAAAVQPAEKSVVTVVPSVPASPTAPSAAASEPTPIPLALSAQELQMVQYGLELLLHATDRDDRLTEPILELIARFQAITPTDTTPAEHVAGGA